MTPLNPLPAFNNFKFGADPELFILNQEGIAVCADGLIPGTKEDPYPVPHGAVQVDGMAAEFNINPASTFEDFNYNIEQVLKSLKKMLPKGYRLHAAPSMVFTEEEWYKSPDRAKILGCSSDMDAWLERVNLPPNPSANPRLRTAAGHLHIGWTENDEGTLDHLENCFSLVRQLDWHLGAWSLTKDKDTARRSLYGRAGSCRVKPYGVEYRVLSNFWLKSPKMRLEVWNRTQQALMNMRTRYLPEEFSHMSFKLVNSIDKSKLSRELKVVLQTI